MLATVRLTILAIFFAVANLKVAFADGPAPVPVAQAFASSSDGTYKLSEYKAPVQGYGTPGCSIGNKWNLTVDDSPNGHKQTIKGFGATVTDATVALFNALPADTLQNLLNDLFNSSGAKYQMVRHTMGSSDMSPEPATSYDDTNDKTDSKIPHFNTSDRGVAMGELLDKMRLVQPELTIVGSPWSAPSWMKTPNNTFDPAYTQHLGTYFTKYLRAFWGGMGVKINAVTIQNDPLSALPGLPRMSISAEEAVQLINNGIGPAIHEVGSQTAIWAYDGNTDNSDYPQTVVDGSSSYVKAVAWQCHAVLDNDWTALSDFHDKNKNYEQYMTNCWLKNDSAWSAASDFTLGPLNNWASGVTAWTLATDTQNGPHLAGEGVCTACVGLVMINPTAKTYELQTHHYMLAQFSKFIPRGASVLSSSLSSASSRSATGVDAVFAETPDGFRAVVIVNKNAQDVYITVETRVAGEIWSGPVGKTSVVTWMLPPLGDLD
ncbi:family 30 glycoside hydrolase [Podospora didyma]|uniref:Family 30 glycoside hydrolase n=1 Tax=Podospora didyma TaxID=330526 RepID=A0AAE0P065_9PEZI|nr:family 30 glycoside hydrolase [Podospora didyma]